MDIEPVAKKILTHIASLPSKDGVIVALDGRCAAGKSTLAELLRRELDCNVFHMDDFFLRPEQRTQERLSEPGGNVDRERFFEEIISPLKSGGEFSFRPYNCQAQRLSAPVHVVPRGMSVIEGSYSCHPDLWQCSSLHVFLSVAPEEQLRRIMERNGAERAEIFRTRWIPLEEKYFAAFDTAARCELFFET